MNKEKYFTPDIEDFHIGYEFEMKVFGDEDEWVKGICKSSIDDICCKDSEGNIWINEAIRVPYLTKEQIEAEGWKESDTLGFFDKIVDPKDRWFIDWEEEEQFITIGDNENEVGYTGPCKDINTFRKIIKLLNIKSPLN